MPRFEVQGRFGFSKNLTMTDVAGAQIAVITGRPYLSAAEDQLGRRARAIVRPARFSSRRFEIGSAAGQLEARGNFSGRMYPVAPAQAQAAAVTRLRTLRERFAVALTARTRLAADRVPGWIGVCCCSAGPR